MSAEKNKNTLFSKWNKNSKEMWNKSWEKGNVGNTLGSITSGLTGVISAGISNSKIADTSNQEVMIEDVEGTQFSSGNYDNLLEAFNANDLAKTTYTGKELRGLSTGQMIGNTLQGIASGATSGATVGGPWGAAAGAVVGLGSGLAGIFTGNRKAREKADELNIQAKKANSLYLSSFDNAVTNTHNMMFNNSLLNLAAYGGPLYNLTGDFSNGLIFINEGGTHESNPLGGVPMGVDNQGVPNLVEEGEVIWNDYVFSNRLKPTKKQLKDGGFKDKYIGWTFAKIVEDINNLYADTPTDPISKAGLEDMMNRIIPMQEEIRMKKQQNNSFKYGGKKGNVFDGTGKLPNFIEVIEESIGPEESDSLIEKFWGAAKTPEQRLAVMGLDPTNAYKKPKEKNLLPWQNSLRYISPFVHAGTLINNLRKPDYSNAERIEKAGRNMPGGTFTPLGDFISLNRVDPNIMVNPILANSAANRRAIQNQAINPDQAIAGLLTDNYNTNLNLGKAYIQGLQANNEIGVTEAQFDRGTRQYNSQAGMSALQMDQRKAAQELQGIITGAQLRDSYDTMRNQAISPSLTGLTGDLGNISREFSDRSLMEKLIESGALRWSAKNGGMLTKKKRK